MKKSSFIGSRSSCWLTGTVNEDLNVLLELNLPKPKHGSSIILSVAELILANSIKSTLAGQCHVLLVYNH